ncbi:MAG: MFS transporter [TACK group archaeon]|nr:MFS transporter [TACK group archaeon]
MAGSISKEFKLVTLNAGISRLGTSAFDLVILWVVLQVTRSPVLSGLGEGILALPLFFSFFLGAIIDKSSHKKGMAIAAAVLRSAMLIVLLIVDVIGSKVAIVIAIYGAAFVIGLTSDLLNSVRASWTKQFLDEELYKAGSSMSNAVTSFFDAAGYAASGLLLTLGYANTFLVLFVVFLAAIPPLMLIKERGTIVQKSSSLGSVREGMSFIAGNRPVVEAMVIAVIINLLFGMTGVMFTALVQISFKLPAYYMSALIVCIMGGAAVGSMLGARVKGKLGHISGASMLVAGLSVVGMAASRSIYLDFVPSLVVGICIGVLNAALMTAFLKIVPYDMMARVQGAFNTFTLAVTFVSGAIGGAFITLLTVKWAIVLIGVLAAASAPLWVSFRELGGLKV